MSLLVLFLILAVITVVLYPLIKTRLTPSASKKAPDRDQPALTHALYRHVEELSARIGSRSVYEYEKINAARQYIENVLQDAGVLYALQTFPFHGKAYSNILVTFEGNSRPSETVIIGAHYDTVRDTPGADDNASGVAILLEMCRALKCHSPGRTLRLIFFALEEPPVFGTEDMGSSVYARHAREVGENIHAMISIEMVGYYSDREGDQSFPLPFMSMIYSTVADFAAVVGDRESRDVVDSIKKSIQKVSDIPVETLASFRLIPGIDLSDHSAFWKMGYRAVMVTDTAFYRNPNYHTAQDTLETLDIGKMYELFRGLIQAAVDLTTV